MSNLEQTGDFLGGQIEKLKKLLIKSPTLAELKQEIDDQFENTQYSQRQYDQYTIAKLSGKIVELEDIIQDRAK